MLLEVDVQARNLWMNQFLFQGKMRSQIQLGKENQSHGHYNRWEEAARLTEACGHNFIMNLTRKKSLDTVGSSWSIQRYVRESALLDVDGKGQNWEALQNA